MENVERVDEENFLTIEGGAQQTMEAESTAEPVQQSDEENEFLCT